MDFDYQQNDFIWSNTGHLHRLETISEHKCWCKFVGYVLPNGRYYISSHWNDPANTFLFLKYSYPLHKHETFEILDSILDFNLKQIRNFDKSGIVAKRNILRDQKASLELVKSLLQFNSKKYLKKVVITNENV